MFEVNHVSQGQVLAGVPRPVDAAAKCCVEQP